MPRGRTDWFGPRLPISDTPRSKEPCDRDDRHTGGIRFELHRYGRRVGQIRLCERCIRSLMDPAPNPDPLYVEEAA